MLCLQALLVSRDAKVFSWTVRPNPLAMRLCTLLTSRDVNVYRKTVRLNPLALCL